MEYKTDFADFCKAWKMSYKLINAKEPSTEVLKQAFDLLNSLPLSLVIEAIKNHVASSEFVIKPANVFAYVDLRTGQTPAHLKNNAYIFYDKYLKNVSGNDVVIEDWRMALAFKECFRSINDFLKRPNREFDISKDRDLFSETVVSHQRYFLDKNLIQHVFIGRRSFRNTIRISFFGDDYDKCKEYATNYYASTKEDSQFNLEYPIVPNLRIENFSKEINSDTKELTEAQKHQTKENMNELISFLTSIQK